MANNYGIVINVLGIYENNSWCALGLEVDIRGYGKTFEEACEDLKNLVLMQISFAFYKGQTDMILRPADPVYFELFSEHRRQRLNSLTEPVKHTEDEKYHVGGVPFPSPQVIAQEKEKFVLENA